MSIETIEANTITRSATQSQVLEDDVKEKLSPEMDLPKFIQTRVGGIELANPISEQDEKDFKDRTEIRADKFDELEDEPESLVEYMDPETFKLQKEDLRYDINHALFNYSGLGEINEEDDDTESTKVTKALTRFARYIDTRPIMRTALATAIGDDTAATFAGLFRNISEGLLNFASASEEAFKGALKFILNLSGVGVTEVLTNIAAKLTLPKDLQHNARHLLLLPYESLDKPKELKTVLEQIQISEPRDRLNSMKALPLTGNDEKLKLARQAKAVFDFAEDFKPHESDLGAIKNFHLLARLLEGGVKGALWAAIPRLNREFRSKVLKQKEFPGLKGVNGVKNEDSGYSPIQKIASSLALASGFIFHGTVIGLEKFSNGKNSLVKKIIERTGFSHGVYPTDTSNFTNQGLAYDVSRLVNSQGKSELFESGLIAGLFTPILYFGHRLFNFIPVIADKKLSKQHNVEPGMLVEDTSKIRVQSLQSLMDKYLPDSLNYKNLMPKVIHDKGLRSDAKKAHAYSTYK